MIRKTATVWYRMGIWEILPCRPEKWHYIPGLKSREVQNSGGDRYSLIGSVYDVNWSGSKLTVNLMLRSKPVRFVVHVV